MDQQDRYYRANDAGSENAHRPALAPNEELYEEFVEEDLEDLDEEEAAEPLQSRGPSASFHIPSSDPHLDNSPRSPALAPNEELYEEFVEEFLEDLDEEEAAEPLQSRGPSASFHIPSSDPHLDNSPRSPALAPNEELYEEFVEEFFEDLDEEEAAEPLQSRGPSASFHIPSSDPHLDNSPRSPALAPNEELYEEFVEEFFEDLDEEEAAEPLQSRGPSASFHSCQDVVSPCEPWYECDWEGCGKRYILPCHLRAHVIRTHGEKKFECPRCHRKYMRQDILSKHMKLSKRCGSNSIQDVVSSCEPLYECDWEGCGKRYKLPCHLRAHVKRTHGEKKFECPRCHRKYMREDILSAHMALSKRCGTSGGRP